MLHRNARRGFAVEIKSAGRRNASLIPTREPKSARIKPEPLARPEIEVPLDEARRVTPAQSGRILPNLIVPEVPAPAIETTAPEPKTRRPYTRRVKPIPVAATPMPLPAVEPDERPVASPAASLASAAPERGRPSDRNAAQPHGLGQRWKRRLSRWSR